ncbi:MAG: hypothetical protein P1T08_03400 [Acidimicrobiia bacterium]|nr:hypothetical protein [Acidimicrobiia bacterium]
MPSHPAPTDILTRERIGNALTALTDPDRGITDPSLHLEADERDRITQALQSSSHPLSGFAATVINQWDQLAADDRVAGLLLTAEIVNSPRHRSLDTPTGRGLER